MSVYPQVHVRFQTMGEPFSTMTILINEDALATTGSQPDMLEHLIVQYGAQEFFWSAGDGAAAADHMI